MQGMTPKPLISAAELLPLLDTPHLRVLDARFSLKDPALGYRSYQAGHIPGATYAHLDSDLSGPVQPSGAGGRHPLPDPQVLSGWLGKQGIGNGNRVVVYDDPSGGEGFGAARAWWLLRWLGHTQVQVLDGGWPAYLAAGGTPSSATAAPTPATFSPQVQPGWVLDAEEVAALPPHQTLIDSRSADRYRGENEALDKRAGHIPGAQNVFWQEALDAGGHFLPAQQQAARFPAGDVALYCGSGVSACVNLLALSLAGREPGPHTQLYAGSWSDWSSDATRPRAHGD